MHSSSPLPTSLLGKRFLKSPVFILNIRLLAFQPHPLTLSPPFPTVGTATPAHSPKPMRPDSSEAIRTGAALNRGAHPFTSQVLVEDPEEPPPGRPGLHLPAIALRPLRPAGSPHLARRGAAGWREPRFPGGGAPLVAGQPGAHVSPGIKPIHRARGRGHNYFRVSGSPTRWPRPSAASACRSGCGSSRGLVPAA